MNRLKIILVAALALSLAGCVLSGKPKTVAATPATPQPLTPPAPPPALSVPQTAADQIPPSVPVNPDALVTAPVVESGPAVALPQGPPRPARVVTPTPKPAEPPAPAPSTVVEPPRQPIREILPPDEQNRLRVSSQKHKSDVRSLVGQAERRGLNGSQQNIVRDIMQFLKQSDQAEQNGDLRGADEFAEKAYILAKELPGGK